MGCNRAGRSTVRAFHPGERASPGHIPDDRPQVCGPIRSDGPGMSATQKAHACAIVAVGSVPHGACAHSCMTTGPYPQTEWTTAQVSNGIRGPIPCPEHRTTLGSDHGVRHSTVLLRAAQAHACTAPNSHPVCSFENCGTSQTCMYVCTDAWVPRPG